MVDVVYVTLQVADDKLQEDELNVPPADPALQVIVPVGVVGEFEVSFTVAVSITEPPAVILFGLPVTVRDVESMGGVVDVLFPPLVLLPVAIA